MRAASCALCLLACAGRGDADDTGVAGAASKGGASGGASGADASAGGTAGSTDGAAGRGGAADGSGGATSGRGGAGTGGSTGGGAGTTGTGGRGGSGSAGSSGAGGTAAAVWDCLDVPGTLCICYARTSSDVPSCSAGYRCCFLLNATSCECFVAEEDCTSAAMQYTQVATCPPP
jgi:hypothetical protein